MNHGCAVAVCVLVLAGVLASLVIVIFHWVGW